MKELVEAEKYRHMAVQNLALYAQRLGKLFASASTWYKMIRQRGWENIGNFMFRDRSCQPHLGVLSWVNRVLPHPDKGAYSRDEHGGGRRDSQPVKRRHVANDRPLLNIHPRPDLAGLKEEIQASYQNAMLFPLVHNEQTLGAIGFYRTDREHYTDDNIRLMEIIAERISAALYRATFFKETTEDAFTDQLTGLSNSRFLFLFLNEAVSEAKSNNECLTIIEMNIDDFKDIRNRHGHHLGNRFPTEVGRLLKAQMREGDVLARHSGDEFVAVLPKTTPEHARQFADSILQTVNEAAIDVGIGKTLSVKMSLGRASFPTDGSDIEELFVVADKNMHEHKARHRKKGRRS